MKKITVLLDRSGIHTFTEYIGKKSNARDYENAMAHKDCIYMNDGHAYDEMSAYMCVLPEKNTDTVVSELKGHIKTVLTSMMDSFNKHF